jgi:signal peptidase II
MSKTLQHLLIIAIASAVIILDQITKAYIRTNLALYDQFAPIPALSDFLTIIHTSNTGAAFGMFKAGGGIFTVIAVIVVAVILYYYPRIPEGQIGIRVALGLQLGGAIGNLIDRLLYGTVTDFVFFHWYDQFNAPIFNVADLSITSGVIVLALLMIIEGRDEKAKPVSPPEAAAPQE